VIVSELLHTDWTEYIVLLESKFPELQINIFSAPQEDAMKMLLNNSAQLALMFEREELNSSEQFIELKPVTLIPVAALHHELSQHSQVSFEQIMQNRQIVVASRDRNIKPELLFSTISWRTDNHHSACSLIVQGLGWGVLPQEILNENPLLKQKLKVLNIIDFTPAFEYFVDLVWNRENELGLAANFLINHIKNERKLK
jgi:DNA-binding transcriptional LysR family regulator